MQINSAQHRNVRASRLSRHSIQRTVGVLSAGRGHRTVVADVDGIERPCRRE